MAVYILAFIAFTSNFLIIDYLRLTLRTLEFDSGTAQLDIFCRAPTIPDTKPPIHDLPEQAFKEELQRLNGTPASVLDNPELMQLLLPMLRADFAVLETYVYKFEQPLDCPITVFGGLQDTEVSHDNLLAWLEHTKASFSVQMFNGDHFFINSAQPLLLKTLAESILAPTCK